MQEKQKRKKRKEGNKCRKRDVGEGEVAEGEEKNLSVREGKENEVGEVDKNKKNEGRK